MNTIYITIHLYEKHKDDFPVVTKTTTSSNVPTYYKAEVTDEDLAYLKLKYDTDMLYYKGHKLYFL